MLYTLRFFSSKCSLFHNGNLFGSCIIHILYTGCPEIKIKNNSGAKGLIDLCIVQICTVWLTQNSRKYSITCQGLKLRKFKALPIVNSARSKISLKKALQLGRLMQLEFFFLPMPPHVLCGLRGPPSWAWQECNRLLRLGRPWGAVTLSRWCVCGDRGGCSARRGLKPKFY